MGVYEPGRKVINVADARLNRTLLRDPERCATINEYADAAGMSADMVLSLLGPYLDDGTLALEFIGEEVFVHTAPLGRPAPTDRANVAPNLWEHLRSAASPELAFSLWVLLRQLQSVGWTVEHKRERVTAGMSKLLSTDVHLGVVVNGTMAPLLLFPSAAEIASTVGPLAEQYRAGARLVGITCTQGALEDMVTGSRSWYLAAAIEPGFATMVLESPAYQPVFVYPTDTAVAPLEHQEVRLQQIPWGS